MENCKWRFVSNQNSTIAGIHDAGIETFTAEVLHSLVRESIQNSLDAKLENSDEPVKVEFSLFTIPADDFPDRLSFQEALNKCLSSNSDEPESKAFFERALELFHAPVHVMRISDHNTTGLRGADTCKKGTPWSRLVKESGSSNKGGDSGGSFGIGKSSAFACSECRCVVYSSMDDSTPAVRSTIGVTRLISFEQEDGGWTTGTGYYSENEKFTAIPTMLPLDPAYRRAGSGTDLFILGSRIDEDAVGEIINSVLINFLVSIIKEKLVVYIQNVKLDRRSVGAYAAKINPYDKNAQLAAVVHYYHLLTSNDPSILKIPLNSAEYGSQYGFGDGDCTLYLQEGENFNRRILMTRSAGMRLFEQDRISASIHFTGILMVEGKRMNAVFKEMEVPSHDAWKPSRCGKNAKKYEAIFSDLKRYLKAKVLENFGKAPEKEMDAFGAGDFLPDTTRTGTEGKQKQGAGLLERVRRITAKDYVPRRKTQRPVKMAEEPADGAAASRRTAAKPAGKRKPETGSRTGPNFKSISIQPRTICMNAASGTYMIKFIVPKKAKRGKLELKISGEQGDYDVPVIIATLVGKTKTTVAGIQGNSIILEDMTSGELLNIRARIDFDAYCMLEVLYYESKK